MVNFKPKSSSYDRIGESFMKTHQWKSYVEQKLKDFAEGGLVSYKFSHGKNYDTKDYEIHPKFVMKAGTREHSTDEDGLTRESPPVHVFLTDNELNEIAEELFGKKGFPTYNCKMDKLEKKWPDFARAAFHKEHVDVLHAFMERCRDQHASVFHSEEFNRDKRRAYERLVIDDIRKVVLQFYTKVGPEVLKEALDEVVVHHITEN